MFKEILKQIDKHYFTLAGGGFGALIAIEFGILLEALIGVEVVSLRLLICALGYILGLGIMGEIAVHLFHHENS
jgi:hypothetical protein